MKKTPHLHSMYQPCTLLVAFVYTHHMKSVYCTYMCMIPLRVFVQQFTSTRILRTRGTILVSCANQYVERVDKHVQEEIEQLRRERAVEKDTFREHNG